MHTVIRHSDRAHFALLDSFDQGLPRTNSTFFATVWSVKQVKINVIKPVVLQLAMSATFFQCPLKSSPRLLEGRLNAILCALIVDIPGLDFRRKEELLSWNSRFEHALRRWFFVPVYSRRVYMTVSGFDCVRRHIFGNVGWSDSFSELLSRVSEYIAYIRLIYTCEICQRHRFQQVHVALGNLHCCPTHSNVMLQHNKN